MAVFLNSNSTLDVISFFSILVRIKQNFDFFSSFVILTVYFRGVMVTYVFLKSRKEYQLTRWNTANLIIPRTKFVHMLVFSLILCKRPS